MLKLRNMRVAMDAKNRHIESAVAAKHAVQSVGFMCDNGEQSCYFGLDDRRQTVITVVIAAHSEYGCNQLKLH